MTSFLRTADGSTVPLDVGRWARPPDALELSLLDGLDAPLLDVGCGPGRLVAAMAAQGRLALGIDPAPTVVATARRQGTPVLRRSVFEPLPGEGRWASAVLLDGNVGIGGDPAALLQRIGSLLQAGGVLLVEAAVRGAASRRMAARVETDGQRSAWFPWAVVGLDDIGDLAAQAELAVARTAMLEQRSFAWLEVPR